MRKILWIVVGLMLLSALGNLIGGRDTPVTASVTAPAASQAAPGNVAPVVPSFETSLYVTASSLNLRDSPSASGRVLGTLARNSLVQTGAQQDGWVNVWVNGQTGWVSGNYLAAEPVEPARLAAPAHVVSAQSPNPVYAAPVQNQSREPVAQRGNDASCPRRQYCTRIGSCAEARWYLANCSWGALLDSDSDSDGVPCEAICRICR